MEGSTQMKAIAPAVWINLSSDSDFEIIIDL